MIRRLSSAPPAPPSTPVLFIWVSPIPTRRHLDIQGPTASVTWDEVAMSQNTKRVPFNMSALGEVVHVDGDKDKNMDETLEEAELQSTVLTLESILLHVFIFLRVYCLN